MLNNNKYNDSRCDFGEQAIAYLYGEIESSEKADFEAHLESCANCAEELAGFGAVRFSMLEWRNEEFLPLETPVIEIPYEKKREFYNSEKDSEVSVSWLEEIRKFFNPAATLTAAAAFALIICCFGIAFFVLKSSNNSKIANLNNEKPEKSILAETKDKTPENTDSKQEISDKSSGIDLAKSPIENGRESNRKIVSQTISARNASIVKTVTNNRNAANNSYQSANQQKIKASNIENKKPLFARTGSVPRLNNVDEEEDKSLRLAELLDDGS
jgi:hypothetical protein